jgi:HJR/Mrr/RecB family endonuclease
MTTATKIQMINEAILRSEYAVNKNAKAEIVNGKVVYSCDRQNVTCVTRIKLTYKEILGMLWGQDARAIYNA